jgi:hypothetical protein
VAESSVLTEKEAPSTAAYPTAAYPSMLFVWVDGGY